MTELIRIDKNTRGELPEKTKMVITISNVEKPEEILNKAKEIMRCISQFAFTNTWPDDQEWKTILPKWFVDSMILKSEKDRDNDEYLWHFESWIESVYHRAWVWWSSKIEENSITIVLETLNIPYLFESLLYVFYAQGISMESMKVVDDIYDKA